MDVRTPALTLPTCAAAALLSTKGLAILHGHGTWSFAILASTGAAVLVASIVAQRIAARRRTRPLPLHVGSILEGTATALGDAALAFDAAGRLIWANAAAVKIIGEPPEALAGRSRRILGDDVEILLHGLARGPASGRVAVISRFGRFALHGAAVRIPGRQVFDVLVLRLPPDPGYPCEVDDSDLIVEPPPPPRPAATPSLDSSRRAPPSGTPAAPAIGPELAGPIGRAAAAAALLRMVLPPHEPIAAQHLARVEEELRLAEAAVTALTAPLPPGSPGPVEVEALLSDTLARGALSASVHVVRSGEAAWAVADAGQLRQALRHALQFPSDAMPSGGVLSLRTGQRDGQVVIEIADTGAGVDAARSNVGLSVARRLVAAQNGTLERTKIRGRGSLCRIVLPATLPALGAVPSSA